MLKKVFTVALCFLLLESVLCADAFALERYQPPAKLARLAKSVQKLGTGEDALVAIRLQDKTVVSGWISDIRRDSLQVVDPNTAQATIVNFLEVNRLQGTNLATGAQVSYGGGVRAKLATVASVLVPGKQVPKNGLTKTSILVIGIVLGVLIAIVVAKTV